LFFYFSFQPPLYTFRDKLERAALEPLLECLVVVRRVIVVAMLAQFLLHAFETVSMCLFVLFYVWTFFFCQLSSSVCLMLSPGFSRGSLV
jgi:hypothetical protein